MVDVNYGVNYTAATATSTGATVAGWTYDSGISTNTAPGCQQINLIPRTYIIDYQSRRDAKAKPGDIIELPDGAKLIVDYLGNYRIDDKNAKVTYQANRVREFSPHLNASDLLAQFVLYVGSLGVKQSEVLGLPIELLINWLVIEAAERDKDPLPADVVPISQHKALTAIRRPKCLQCGRWIPRLHARNRFAFCGPEHGERWLGRNRGKAAELLGVRN